MEHIFHVSTWTLPFPIETKQHPNQNAWLLKIFLGGAQQSCFICHETHPKGSMYVIFTYIWLICMVNVGKYTIHRSSGHVTWNNRFNVDVSVLQVKPTKSSGASKWLNPNALFPSCSSWATPRATGKNIGKFLAGNLAGVFIWISQGNIFRRLFCRAQRENMHSIQ